MSSTEWILLFLLVHCGGVYVVTQSLLTRMPRERARQWLLNRLDSYIAARARGELPWMRAIPMLVVGFIIAILQCPACFGFWWALLLNHLGYWPFQQVVYQPIEAALAGVAIGALWSFYTTAEVDDAQTKEKEDER